MPARDRTGSEVSNAPKIQEYLNATMDNRAHGPVFYGREEELAHFGRLYQAVRNDRKLSTSLISGPPGMGKTSLLEEAATRLAKQIGEDYSGLRFRPLVVMTSETGRLTDMESFRELCAEHVRENHPWTRRAKQAAAAVLRASPKNLAEMEHAAKGIEESGDPAFYERPFIFLLVDEIQTSDGKNTEFYKTLHTSKKTPRIVPVYAGLADSARVLEEKVKITRVDPRMHFRLPRLERTSVDRIVEKTLAMLEIETDSMDRWQDLAMERSEGFPRHLQSVLYGMAQTALGRKILDADAMDEVVKEAEKDKTAYYAQRVGASQWKEEEKDLAYEILRNRTNQKTPTKAAIAAMNEAEGRNVGREEAREFLDQMVHIGILTNDGGDYQPGIPSFGTWLKEDCEKRARAQLAKSGPALLEELNERDQGTSMEQPPPGNEGNA